MLSLLKARALHSIILIVAVVSVVFLTNFVIGDPVKILLPPSTPPEAVELYRHNLGLDRPILVQYFDFMKRAFTGDFGDSWWQKTPALPIALRPFPATLELGIVAMLFATLVGLTVGLYASARPRSLVDRIATSISFLGISSPLIWLALMLALIFSVKLGWFPTSGYGTLGHMVLPTVALAALPLGRIVQITRAAMLDELAKPYIVTARAKGLSEKKVFIKHALRNALPPIITEVGWETALLLTGYTIIVESVYGWPGFGFATYNAILTRDLPVITALAFVASVVVVVINFLTDIAYWFANPTIRLR